MDCDFKVVYDNRWEIKQRQIEKQEREEREQRRLAAAEQEKEAVQEFSDDLARRGLPALRDVERMEAKRATPFLLRALDDPSPAIFEEAAEVLGKQRNRDAVPMLAQLLGNATTERVAHALVEIDSDQAISALLDSVEHARIGSYFAEQELTNASTANALFTLFQKVHDPNVSDMFRGKLDSMLECRIADPRTLPTACLALADQATKDKASWILCQLRKLGRPVDEELLRIVDDEEYASHVQRRAAARELATAEGVAVSILLSFISKVPRDLVIRSHQNDCILRVGESGDMSALPTLFMVASRETDNRAEYCSVKAALLLDPEGAPQIFYPALVSNPPRYFTLDALSDCLDPLVLSLGELYSVNRSEESSAYQFLLSNPRAISSIVDMGVWGLEGLSGQACEATRALALWTLSRIQRIAPDKKTPEQIEALGRLFSMDFADQDMKVLAARALAKFGPEGIDKLVELRIREFDPIVRREMRNAIWRAKEHSLPFFLRPFIRLVFKESSAAAINAKWIVREIQRGLKEKTASEGSQIVKGVSTSSARNAPVEQNELV